MNKIELKVASRGLFLLQYFGSAIVAGVPTIFLFKFFQDVNKLLFIIIFGGIWYIVNRFTKKTARGRVELEIKKDGIKIDWKKQFLLHNKKDTIIKWEEIKDYMFQPEQYFNLFRIRTKNKRKYRFSMIGENDDFPIFYQKLEKEIKDKATNQSIDIKRAKNIYESTYGIISAIIMCIMIIGAVIAFFVIGPKGKPNYAFLFASLVGGLFFIFQVIDSRKKNKGS